MAEGASVAAGGSVAVAVSSALAGASVASVSSSSPQAARTRVAAAARATMRLVEIITRLAPIVFTVREALCFAANARKAR